MTGEPNFYNPFPQTASGNMGDVWQETAAQHLRNEEYYHEYRDELLNALKAIYVTHPELVLAQRPDFVNELNLLDRSDH